MNFPHIWIIGLLWRKIICPLIGKVREGLWHKNAGVYGISQTIDPRNWKSCEFQGFHKSTHYGPVLIVQPITEVFQSFLGVRTVCSHGPHYLSSSMSHCPFKHLLSGSFCLYALNIPTKIKDLTRLRISNINKLAICLCYT